MSPSPHIEFGNRLLTGALCAVVGWLVVAAAPLPATATATWARVRRLITRCPGRRFRRGGPSP